MFSSNQILEVTGCLEHKNDLYNSLEFALKASNHTKGNIVYQITQDGRYCIGWMYMFKDAPTGWSTYPFDFDLTIVSQIIEQHLRKQKIEYGGWDGSYNKGFLMKAIEENMDDDCNGIKNPFYGIVEFSPYTCFYSK